MKIPQLYLLIWTFKDKKRLCWNNYWGVHRDFNSAYLRAIEVGFGKKKGEKWLGATVLPWKGLFFALLPGIFIRQDKTKEI